MLDRYELADRYRADRGTVFLTGSQALARLPLAQLRADRRHGRRTAAYVTGYPGSPLANYERDAAAAATEAAAEGLTLLARPAVNEELAAAAVMGTQLTAGLDSRRVDGVIGVWYGKTPGLDRAGDALRHAVFAGTAALGGAVALVGEDPGAKSSTLPSTAEATLLALHIPVLCPGDVQDAVELGRHAIAMSRASGSWTAMRVVESVADGTGTVELVDGEAEPILPVVEIDGRPWVPQPDGRLITPASLELERQHHEIRLPLARRYGVDNGLNRATVTGPADWLAIVAAGHTYVDVVAALEVLGLSSPADLRHAGIRLVKIGLLHPLDPHHLAELCATVEEVVVVEEKQPTLERLVKDALYGLSRRPRVTGKQDDAGNAVFPVSGVLNADRIAERLHDRLAGRLGTDRLRAPRPPRQLIPLGVQRTPYFCSGCPHNTSTQAPPGSLVGAGIGCHTMAMFLDPERVGSIVGVGAMGGEGAPWIGMAPFVSTDHLIQNLGDGTMFHSGWLAIRAAVAAGVNITYKILLNGAVAMTGGQDAVGRMELAPLVAGLRAEGVTRVMVTTDDRARTMATGLPGDVEVWDRSRVVEAQQVLAAVPGCTVLIHDQQCAAEKRRDRKRGLLTTPATRVIINERVCEGCGDCAARSNCLSLQPVDTPGGRATRIDQHSCNLDLSCLVGDCPAFATVTVTGAARDGRSPSAAGAPATVAIPDPPIATAPRTTIRLSGIGGTGVVTVSQVLGTAAMLDGLSVRGLDQTGLSQKGGPVVSDLVISQTTPAGGGRARAGSVDVLLAFDQLVAGGDAQLAAASAEHTVAVINQAVTPTGAMVARPALGFPHDALADRIAEATNRQIRVDAGPLVRALLGDDSTVNVFLTGVAAQHGLLPVRAAAIERAIELNGVAVERNLDAFRWGRAWVADPSDVARRAGLATHGPRSCETLDQLIDRLAADLTAYHSPATAAEYRAALAPVQALGHDPLTETVARNLHRLTAYKDEYEVARLLLAPEARAAAEAVGGRGTTVTWHLHPPMLRALGLHRKLRLGRSARPALLALRTARRLRGTPADPFARNAVRRVERAMIPEYRAAISTLLAGLGSAPSAERLAAAVAIAGLPDQVRGYEQLKLTRAATYRAELARRLAGFGGP